MVSGTKRRGNTVLYRSLREPLVHFLVVGAAIYGIMSAFGQEEVHRPNRIAITEATVNRLSSEFEATWRRPPDTRELNAMVEDFVREEIYVREALALGLDQDDAVIRKRLRQKMEFVAASIAGAIEPTEEELREFFAENSEKYAIEGTVALEQIFLGERPDDGDVDAVHKALAGGADPMSLGQRTMLPREIGLSSALTVDNYFGPGFYRAVTTVQAGNWVGPVRSSFGYHLVRVTERNEPANPKFESVIAAVSDDWRRANVERIVDMNFERLRERYEITLPERDRP